jgi:hypothetical protein
VPEVEVAMARNLLREKVFRSSSLSQPLQSDFPSIRCLPAHNIAADAMHCAFGEKSDVGDPDKQSQRNTRSAAAGA